MSEAGRRRKIRVARSRPLLAVAVTGLVCTLAVFPARSGDLAGFAELGTGKSRTSVEAPGSETVDFSNRYFSQRYALNWRRSLFPRLLLRLGGTMERQDTRLEPGDVDAVQKRIFPTARLTLSTPTFYSELLADRSAERTVSGGAAGEIVRQTYRATAGWTTPTLRSRLEFRRTSGFDLGRRGLDSETDRTDLSFEWLPASQTTVSYRAGYEDAENKILLTENRTLSHSARLGHANSWRQGRVAFAGEYVVGQTGVRATAFGGGEIAIPVIPFEGLSSIDDTPERDPLTTNNALVDRDRESPAGLDIAAPLAGGNARPRNLGFDLGGASPVNRVVVWVDRTLPSQIAAVFSWRVYTSDDNLDWTFRATVPTAPFGPVENRFLVDFPDVVARYVKLVVSPLTPGTPGASDFPTIAITEIEALRRSIPDDRTSRASSISQQLNTSVRVQILPKPSLVYEFAGFASDSSRGPVTGTMTNSLALSERLAEIYSVAARLSREDSWGGFADAPAHLLAASLFATPIPTLSHTLSFGARDEMGDNARDDLSVTYGATAVIYRGVDANFVARRSGSRARVGGSSVVSDLGAGLSVAPHRAFSLTGYYSRGETEFRGDVIRPGFSRRASDLAVSWRPFTLLYLNAGRRWETQETGRSLRLDNAAVSWTPFPAGALRVAVSYGEVYRTDTDGVESYFSSGLRWSVSPRAYLDMSYQNTKVENRVLETLSTTSGLFASARISF